MSYNFSSYWRKKFFRKKIAEEKKMDFKDKLYFRFFLGRQLDDPSRNMKINCLLPKKWKKALKEK